MNTKFNFTKKDLLIFHTFRVNYYRSKVLCLIFY